MRPLWGHPVKYFITVKQKRKSIWFLGIDIFSIEANFSKLVESIPPTDILRIEDRANLGCLQLVIFSIINLLHEIGCSYSRLQHKEPMLTNKLTQTAMQWTFVQQFCMKLLFALIRNQLWSKVIIYYFVNTPERTVLFFSENVKERMSARVDCHGQTWRSCYDMVWSWWFILAMLRS